MKFMDGVTLIEECTELSNKCIIFMFLFSFVVAFVAFIFGYVLSYKKKSIKVILFCGIMILGTFIGKHFIIDKYEEPNGEYEVVLDNDIDMNEFYRRYEIVGFKDGIYTITLKDSREVQEY